MLYREDINSFSKGPAIGRVTLPAMKQLPLKMRLTGCSLLISSSGSQLPAFQHSANNAVSQWFRSISHKQTQYAVNMFAVFPTEPLPLWQFLWSGSKHAQLINAV
jgi:hypothetical protein